MNGFKIDLLYQIRLDYNKYHIINHVYIFLSNFIYYIKTHLQVKFPFILSQVTSFEYEIVE